MRKRDPIKVDLVKEQAIRLLVEGGIEGFSVNRLARQCHISVATLYIYYKDKEDLITQIGTEVCQRMSDRMLENFDPESSFETGLRNQWTNRAHFMLSYPMEARFIELLNHSSYQEKISAILKESFKPTLGRFLKNAIQRGEIEPMSAEVYWSVAFAPLYHLIKLHHKGKGQLVIPFN